MKYVLLHVGDTMDPDEVKVPKPPDDWVGHDTNTAKGEPTLYKVENSGGWIRFSYRPVFASGSQGGQYKFHFIPDSCQPVPPNEDGSEIFTHGGWIFLTGVEEVVI